VNEELYQEEIGKLLAERNVLHVEACQVWTHVPDGYKLASVGNPVEAVRLMVEGLSVLAADGAALRERLAAAEQDRLSSVADMVRQLAVCEALKQAALAQERARVEAEFARLIELATPLGATLKEIVAARERLLEGETRKQ